MQPIFTVKGDILDLAPWQPTQTRVIDENSDSQLSHKFWDREVSLSAKYTHN